MSDLRISDGQPLFCDVAEFISKLSVTRGNLGEAFSQFRQQMDANEVLVVATVQTSGLLSVESMTGVLG